MIRRLFFLSFFFFTQLLVAQESLLRWQNDFDKNISPLTWENQSNIFFDSTLANHFSRLDSVRPYGVGYKGFFPQEVLNRSLQISINAKVRCSDASSNFLLVYSVVRGDSTIFWESKKINVSENWKDNKVNFALPGNVVVPGNSLVFFFWKQSGGGTDDVDNLSIEFSELSQPGFFPAIKVNPVNGKAFALESTTDHFKLALDRKVGQVILLSAKNDTLLQHLSLVINYKLKQEDRIVKQIVLNKILSVKNNNTASGSEVICTYQSKIANVALAFILDKNHSVSITADLTFLKNVFVERATVIANYGIELNEVYTKNSEVDSTDFKKEYWLDKEGWDWSGAEENFLVYRNTTFSSLQLSPRSKSIAFNLDFSLDHPYMHFPLLDKSKAINIDRSCNNYLKGEHLVSTLKILAKGKKWNSVRLLKNPSGFPASMIWTEHADFSDIRTQRALNFGSENITMADSSNGGFIGHHIPMTKSVFYSNPEHQLNSVKDGRFKTEAISITASPEFKNFLDQINMAGIEICLHTPDPFTTTHQRADSALKFMKENYSSVSWIDHGYDNAPTSNREDIVCDGLNPTAANYIGDLLKLNGVKYFWNNYYEDSALYKNIAFNSNFSSPYAGWGDVYPSPQYFLLPVRDKSFYSWTTNYTLDPPNGDLWNYYFSEQRLNDLVQTNSNCILHCYPARVDSTTGFYFYNHNQIEIHPEFDQVLSRLKKYNDDGKIWLTTVKELIDYRRAIEKISIDYSPSGQVLIMNEGDQAIEHVSFATTAQSISAGEKNITIKRRDNETIFILSLAPHEKVVVYQNK